jgi:signal peptidase I
VKIIYNDDVPEMPPFTDKSDGASQLPANRLIDKTQVVLKEMWREVCEKRGSLNFRIVSGSMSPLIKADDVVKVSRVEPSRVRIGDIIAFQSGQNVVVHRVIWKSRSSQQLRFRQMGDACRSSARFPARNLIGKVTVIQKQGYEKRLDSPGQVIGNKIIGWRLLFKDTYKRKLRQRIISGLRKAFRPIWRLCRAVGSSVVRRKR